MTTDSNLDIFTAEEEMLRTGARLLASGTFASASDREEYSRLLDGYRILLAQMKRVVRISDRMEGKLNRTSLRFEEISNLDSLTGLYNRRYFDARMPRDWNLALRARSPISLVMMDVDHFKDYNDSYGHPEGDACLRMVGAVLDAELKRPGDWAARYGGEEFVLYLPDTDSEGGARVARVICKRIAEQGDGSAQSPLKGRVTLSAGVASMIPDFHVEWALLVKAADDALYAAKRAGRNCVEIGCFEAS
jgi:diguanylate cyclase (GGDEF)-like protein